MTPTDEIQKSPIRMDLPAGAPELGQEGTVVEVLHSGMFRVRLPDRGEIVAHLAGRLRMLPVRLLPGDHVLVQVSPYNPSRGRILERL